MKVNNNCVGCGQCAAFCKFGAIDIRGKASFNSACIQCRACAAYCPVKAIEV
jgi:ferredoxin